MKKQVEIALNLSKMQFDVTAIQLSDIAKQKRISHSNAMVWTHFGHNLDADSLFWLRIQLCVIDVWAITEIYSINAKP